MRLLMTRLLDIAIARQSRIVQAYLAALDCLPAGAPRGSPGSWP